MIILFLVFSMKYFGVLKYIKIFEQPTMLLFVSFAVCLKQKYFDTELHTKIRYCFICAL